MKGALRGRGARNAESANRFEIRSEVFRRRKSGNWDRRLHARLHHRLRGRGVTDMAYLAVLLVVVVSVPVGGGVRPQREYREDQHSRQQIPAYSLRRTQADRPPAIILALMLRGGQSSHFSWTDRTMAGHRSG